MYTYKEKYCRPTSKDEGHTKIYINGLYIGYIMPDRAKCRPVNVNWHFVGKQVGYHSIATSNRSDLINAIKDQYYT